jgi:5-methyltetrahydrofolate--homocysteine methyltransferase
LPPLLDVLHSGRTLLMDGAMGTQLQLLGLRPEENAATWNILHPKRVAAVHAAYRAAGAEVLLTNTFLMFASSYAEQLARDGLTWSDRFVPWWEAYERIGPQCYRIADLGPVAGPESGHELGDLRSLWVPDTCPECHSSECHHCPDAVLLETCSTARVRQALARLRRFTSVPLLLSLTYQRDSKGRLVTRAGHGPEWFAKRAAEYGIAALGANCGKDIGMDEIIAIVRRYRQETDLPLFARPNAGTPIRAWGHLVYPETPERMADRLLELIAAGASMVGGCCGTTPAHIAAFQSALATVAK